MQLDRYILKTVYFSINFVQYGVADNRCWLIINNLRYHLIIELNHVMYNYHILGYTKFNPRSACGPVHCGDKTMVYGTGNGLLFYMEKVAKIRGDICRLVVEKIKATLEKRQPCYSPQIACRASHIPKSQRTEFCRQTFNSWADMTPTVNDTVNDTVHVHEKFNSMRL